MQRFLLVRNAAPARAASQRHLRLPGANALRVGGITAVLLASVPAQGWLQRTTLTAPPARSGHAMAYDLNRGIATLFGGAGAGGGALADTWDWNGISWAARSVSNAPSARTGHAMAFDVRRDRIVLFGGYAPSTASWRFDTWEWDGNSWTERNPALSPPARSAGSLAYDSWRGRSVLFGGQSSSSSLADTWSWDGANWTQLTTTGPAARHDASLSFDDARGTALLFGGGNGTQVFGDTWQFDGTTWQALTPANAPSPRWGARMAYDTLCGVTVLHGGADAGFTTSLGDGWQWDGSNWSAVPGASPPARHDAAMIFDAQKSQWILWGGRDASGYLGDTWRLLSSCSRTMSVVRGPQVGATAQFRLQYPPSAAFHYYCHFFTAPQSGSFPVPIPGVPSIGLARVDVFNILASICGFLDASGTNSFGVSIPLNNAFAGLSFDVQSADLSLATTTLYWAGNDLEVTVAPAPPAPVAQFTADRILGAAPMTVQFTDTSTGTPTGWQWDFDNNGTIDSTLQNPSHTYTNNGIYSVRLVASNLGGSTTSIQTNLINVGPSPNPALNMIEIPPGTFSMGSNAGTPYEQPVHPVSITRTFWIGKYEVTQAQYLALMGNNPSFHQGNGYPNAGQRPVERVSYLQAKAYCTALTSAEGAAGRLPPGYVYRLPTEAEWEYSCRAGTATEWSTGIFLGTTQANWRGLLADALNVFGQTSVVGNHPANAFGLCDMHGNVWEWCLDMWVTASGYAPGAVSDPFVNTGNFSIVRGGSFHLFSSGDCRSAYRNFYGFAGTSSPVVGFRVVLGPPMNP